MRHRVAIRAAPIGATPIPVTLIVIAEGVENEQSLALLRKYGCDMVRGFFFSPPIDAAALFDRRRAFVAA